MMNTATASFAPPPASPAIPPAELERLYRIRMSLSPEQRAEVERQYDAYLAGNPPNRAPAPAGPESLDPVEAAAFNVEEDPEVGVDLSAYADRPAYSPEGMQRAANLPPDAGPSGYADRSPAYSERNLGRAARGPIPQPRALQSDVEARTRELVSRGIDPESARAIAEVEISNPQDPNDPNPTNSAKKAVIKANVRRFNDGRAAAQQQAEADWQERNFGEDDRLRKELSDAAARGSPDARLHMPETADWRPETAADRKKWKDWTTGGSLERMAQYAPEEFDRRWDAAAAERKKENDRMRTDPEYRKARVAAEKRTLDAQTPAANFKLRRELREMGIDTDPFESNASNQREANEKFDRFGALEAKRKAKAARKAGTYDAVIRRAQAQQNPLEYLGRSDVTDEQKQTLAAIMLGRGATPNDVAAMQAKMFLEGLQQGARQNVNVNTPELQQAQADAVRAKLDQDRRTMREPDEDVLGEKYAPGGWFGYDEFTVAEQQQMYDDLIAQGYTPAEAQRAVDRQATKRRASDRSWKPAAPKGK